jgi:hypothetical protein
MPQLEYHHLFWYFIAFGLFSFSSFILQFIIFVLPVILTRLGN